MTNNVLILGANGRFGRATHKAFTNASWNVTALVRPEKSQGGKTIEADASDPAALSAAAQGFDVIVNALNPPYHKWAEMLPILTASVIAAARTSGATVLIPGNVYNFGTNPPPVLSADTPQAAVGGKGEMRIEMERAYRDAPSISTIILRGGDFIEAEKSGNWFDGQITNKIDKGVITYPGPTDQTHAWAYLPDMARAAVSLCEIRETLPRFADIPFEGFALTGHELIHAVEVATGKPLKVKTVPWGIMSVIGLFSPLIREIISMRYLWNKPHKLDGAALKTLLPDFEPTPLNVAMQQVLHS
ncbi:MAG: NAD(P)H-binding protein [Alphaproteobacteria bacterium]